MNYIPSKKELYQTDQILFSIAFVSFVFTIAIILMLLQKYFPFDSMVMEDYLTFFLYPLVACVALPYFFYRCNRIRSLFLKGEEVVAQVIFMDDDLMPWFVIRYEFIYEDKIYNQALTIMYTKKSKKIAEKNDLVVMFDPICKRSYIRDVF
jgi:hypothetical protein